LEGGAPGGEIQATSRSSPSARAGVVLQVSRVAVFGGTLTWIHRSGFGFRCGWRWVLAVFWFLVFWFWGALKLGVG